MKKRIAKKLFGIQVKNLFSEGKEIKCLVDNKLGDYGYILRAPEPPAAHDEIEMEES